MTYTELAGARGISKSSAERLVFRNRWRRQRGNNGITRALVPLDSLTGDVSGDASGGIAPAETPDMTGDINHIPTQALAVLEEAVSALQEQLDRTNKRAEGLQVLADTALGQLAEVEARAERTEQGMRERLDRMQVNLDAARQRAQEAVHAADQARVAAQEAQDAAEALRRADETRKARGRLRRVWAAWRGE
jgi:hypothetical protein